ncbi:MAG: PDZ domain-containing protein [Armatimonadota bacterium]
MKQNVNAPVAAIIILVAVVVFIALFTRPDFSTGGAEKTFVLPPSPPVDEQETQSLRQALGPLGIACVMPPLNSDRFKGARVALVMPGGPADRGGMKPGDLITKFDEIKVSSPYSVAAGLQRVSPQKASTAIVVRAGKEVKLSITGLRPARPQGRVLP